MTMIDVKLDHVSEWEITNDIGVEHKERLLVLAKDFTGQCQWTGRSKRLGLDGKCDGDTQILLNLLHLGDHELGSVVDGQDNVLDSGLVIDKRVETVGNTLTSAWIWCKIIGSFANGTRGFGTVSVNGRRRVPKPPTRINAFILLCENFSKRENSFSEHSCFRSINGRQGATFGGKA